MLGVAIRRALLTEVLSEINAAYAKRDTEMFPEYPDGYSTEQDGWDSAIEVVQRMLDEAADAAEPIMPTGRHRKN